MSQAFRMTPYERFIRESLEQNKKELEALSAELQKAGLIRKKLISSHIAEINQNIDILSKDLEKYGHGLSWLREPTKERDEKAEKLGPVDVSAILGASKPQAATPGGAPKPAAPIGAKPGVPGPGGAKAPTPTVVPKTGVPVGAPRPSVGTPRPSVGTLPVGTQRPTVGQPPQPAVATPSTAVPSSGPHPAPPPSESEHPAQQQQKAAPEKKEEKERETKNSAEEGSSGEAAASSSSSSSTTTSSS